MKPTDPNPVLSYLLYFAIVMALYFIGHYVRRWGKETLANENEYEKLYLSIEEKIDKFTVNRMNYNILMNQLAKLGHMKHRNREKTTVITVTFLHKFKREAKRQVEEND